MMIFASQAPQQDVREVVAEGRAVRTSLDSESARKAAVANALRNAVEKTLGVYVSGQTLTKNYALLRDQVLARSDGHAVLKELLLVEQLPQEIRVILRASVSVRPLTEQVRALGLARAWRVQTTQPLLEKALGEAGFMVVSDPKLADLALTLTPRHTTLAELPLETAAGPMTMYTVRSEVILRALRGTEIIAVRMGTETARHIRKETAQEEATATVLTRLAPLLVEELLQLPSRLSQPVALTVRGVTSAESAQRFTDALGALPSVQSALKRQWSGTVAIYELEVPTDSALAAELKSLGLTVLSETKGQLTATTQRAAPKPLVKPLVTKPRRESS
jgi:hypothetical protein